MAYEGNADQSRVTRRSLLRGAGLGLGALTLGGAASALPAGAAPVLGDGVGGGKEPLRLARAWASTPAQWAALATFDDTHQVFGDGSVELLLWPGDLARLDASGLRYQVTVTDLVARDNALRAGETPGGAPEGVPGAKTAYRTLAEFNADMQALATQHSDKVRMFRLPLPTLQSRSVYGIEVCADVARNDGRPVFYMDGLHHAREWPAGEMTIMFGYDLVENYGKDADITFIMDNVRTVLVPVVNPDGFVRSRESATSAVSTNTPVTTPLAVSEFEYHRKNMRRHTSQPEETGAGVDVNRNYSGQWGGAGASASKTSQTHHGLAPFSEPESENVRRVVSALQAITLNSNHTYSRLVLRPPGYKAAGVSPDEQILKSLGDAMGKLTGYKSQRSWELYDTTGTTMDWAYSALASLAYTFEHGTSFHPTYSTSIPQMYVDGKNRDAFILLAKAAADPANYSVLRGRAVDAKGQGVRARVEVSKTFDVPLWNNGNNPIGQASYTEATRTMMDTASDGEFTYRVTPSRRPYEPGQGVPYDVTVVAADGREFSRKVRVERGQALDLGDVQLS